MEKYLMVSRIRLSYERTLKSAPVIVLVFLSASLDLTNVAKSYAASPAAKGEQIFMTNCAVCHAAGANIIDPSKPVKGSKKLVSLELFKSLLTKPEGSMPSFPQIAQNEADLTALLTYCKNLK